MSRPRDPMRRRRAILAVAALALLVAGADQAGKYLAVRDLTVLFEREPASGLAGRVARFYEARHLTGLARAPVTVLPGLWEQRYAENPGAAFSLLAGASAGARRILFLGVGLVALGLVGFTLLRGPRPRAVTVLALGAILGGALGNLVDRATRGYVIDYIDWHIGSHPWLDWPTFNVADVALTIGALLLLLQVIREPSRHDP